MSIASHCRAAISLTAITLNLLFWCGPVLAAGLIKLVVPAWRIPVNRLLEGVYRSAVHVDDFWLKGLMGISWDSPPLDLPRDQNVIVLSNHVSWADILLIQSVIARNGPILKFLAKRQLIFVPIFGAIFWAFDFPIVRRAQHHESDARERRRVDLEAIREACRILESSPAALANFAEGTRFTEEKRIDRESPFAHLLPPRVGGFSAVLDAMEGHARFVVDLTVKYAETRSFWEFLGGLAGEVEIEAELIPLSAIPRTRDERAAWLAERWTLKDQRIEAFRRSRS